ncbi:MAG: DUF4215 domain-containing protein [Myxococcota bacterium]
MLLSLLGAWCATPTLAATFTVTSTADSGAGTLREAVESAEASAGADTIAFAIPGAGVHVIALDTPLPKIEETVLIDGLTQPGASCGPRGSGHTLMIQIDGQAYTAHGHGLRFLRPGATGSVVRGVAVTGFRDHAILIEAAPNVTVQCNYVGVDPDGVTANPNRRVGVDGRSTDQGTVSDLLVGTDGDGVDDDLEWNLVSGNRSAGLRLASSSNVSGVTTGVVIAGNLVGSTAAGDAPVSNDSNGLMIYGEYTGIRVGTDADGQSDEHEGNLFSGNRYTHLTVTRDYVHQLVIAGNQFGSTLDGSALLDPNRRPSGIWVSGDHDDMQIGGPTAVEANRFLNLHNAVSFYGDHKIRQSQTVFAEPGTFYNGDVPERAVIEGNLIGVASDGSAVPVRRALRVGLAADVTFRSNTVLGDGDSGHEAIEVQGAEVEIADNTFTDLPEAAIEVKAYTGNSSVVDEFTTPDDVLSLVSIHGNDFAGVNLDNNHRKAGAVEAFDSPVDPIHDDQGATVVASNTWGDMGRGVAVVQKWRGAAEYVADGAPAIPEGPVWAEAVSVLWTAESTYTRVRTMGPELSNAVLLTTSNSRDMTRLGHWREIYDFFRDTDGQLDVVSATSRCAEYSFDGKASTHSTDSGVGLADGLDFPVAHPNFTSTATGTVSRYQIFELEGSCEVCGNGVTTGAETCDDGNTVDGDGCSSTCTLESGYVCPALDLPATGVDASTGAHLDAGASDPRWSVATDGGSFEAPIVVDVEECNISGLVQNTVVPGSHWLAVPGGDPCSTIQQDKDTLLTFRTRVDLTPADLGAGLFEYAFAVSDRIEAIRVNGVAIDEHLRSRTSSFRYQEIPTTDFVVGSNTVEIDVRNPSSRKIGLSAPHGRSVCGLDTDGDGVGDAGDPDADNDGIANVDEGTDDADGDGVPAWLDLDSDGDGTFDVVDTVLTDADGDGIVDGPDTDGDGVLDALDADPNDPADSDVTTDLSQDTDGDGLSDSLEESLGTDPTFADTDGDLLTDGEEVIVVGSDPTHYDTDEDGLLDGLEVLGLDTVPGSGDETDAIDADTDDDGLSDRIELFGPDGLLFSGDETDPVDPDTDGDGLLDGIERGVATGVAGGESPGGVTYDGTDPAVLLDDDPSTTTDPNDDDTDGDGVLDGNEDLDLDGAVSPGETDPLDPSDG